MHQPYMSYFRTSQALFSIFIIYSLPALSPNKHYLMKCNRECVLFNMKEKKTEKISHIQVEMSLFSKKKTVQKAIKSESFGYQSFSCTSCIFMPCCIEFEANSDF